VTSGHHHTNDAGVTLTGGERAADKLSWGLFDVLRGRGLVKAADDSGWEPWLRVEATTADAYMAYLACAISGAHPDMLPVTDREMAIGKVMVSRQ
jgi:hypothetical protein